MIANVGTTDRILRIVLGAVMIALVFFGPRIAPEFGYWSLGWLGAVFIVTALVSFCPLYRIFGLRSCPLPK